MAAELDKSREEADNTRAIIARVLGMEHFSTPTSSASPETPIVTEQPTLRKNFTDAEKKELIAYGARIYTPYGTIPDQKAYRDGKGKPSFANLRDLVYPVPDATAKEVEVAIFPAPDRAFVPGSFGQNVTQLQELVAADAADLRRGLGLTGIGEIIPEDVATITGIVFLHEEATGEWLIGDKYAAAQEGLSWVFAITENPTNSSGSHVASVGYSGPKHGVHLGKCLRDEGDRHTGVLRMIVPIETQ